MDFQGKCLLISVHIQNRRVPIVWLQAERWSYHTPGTIQFSAGRPKLREACDDYTMATIFATLNFCHVIDLLNTFTIPHRDRYAWRWVCLNLGMLHQGFGGSWVELPSPRWLEKSILFSPSYATRVESMQRQFAIQYPNARNISLRDQERWKHEPASPSQASDLTLAGTKGEIAHSGSAPTAPEEHLQRPRPMQSPNANGGEPPRRLEINRSNVLASKLVESPTSSDSHRLSISRTRNSLSGRTNERRPVQPTNPSSTPTPPTLMSPKEASTGIDQVTSILQGVLITAPAEASGQGPHASPPFSNPQASPFETPNLTGRIVRSGSIPMARGGYSSVWRGSLISTTSNDPHRTLQVLFSVDGSQRVPVLTTDSLGCPQGASCFVYG
jgi:hypothetical protein